MEINRKHLNTHLAVYSCFEMRVWVFSINFRPFKVVCDFYDQQIIPELNDVGTDQCDVKAWTITR